VEQQGNGGHKLSPEFLARVEAALDSERRQRELLERRLRDTERSLETALAAVSAPHGPDADLLQLKSQLATEMATQAARATLELNLLELELVANAEAEAAAAPASAGAQRIIQYVNVPEAAPQPAPAQPAPKDFDDKMASAQMAIDAAEARASHNAVQVRKLTEELASARAEQIRLSAAMRGLRERFDATALSPTPAARWTNKSDAAAAAPVEMEAPGLLSPAHETAPMGDAIDELAAALSESPALEEHIPQLGAPMEGGEGLEDALQAWGDLGESHEQAEANQEVALEDALSAWGEAESTDGDKPSSPRQEAEPSATIEDSLLAVLESWGNAPEVSAPEVVEVLTTEEEGTDWGALLEVDSLERLDTPDTSTEQRLAEALGDDVVPDSTEPVEVLDDLEPATLEVEEPSHRWEPDTSRPQDDDELLIEAFASPEPAERFQAEEDIETLVPEVLEPEPEVADIEAEEEAPAEEPASVLEALETAESSRRAAPRPIPAAPLPEPVVEEEPVEDFEPDYAAIARRAPDARREEEAPARAPRGGGRKSMIDALQQFIGE
jgi:hypothetical protein